MKNFHSNSQLHFKDITLLVKNIDVMLDFYTKVIGLKLISKDENLYNLGTSKHILVKLLHDSEAIYPAQRTGLYHFALLLPNRASLGQILYHFLQNSVELTGASDHGVSEALYLNDPEGNGIEIYSDRKVSEWPLEGGRTTMFTEMMDAAGVLEERDKEPFTNINEDTVMGHLHLHVNNIVNAFEFFNNLGFEKVIDYGGRAVFLSDDGYHHHLGMNTWGGTTNPNRSENETGLVGYTMFVPENKKSILDNIVDLKQISEKEYETRDINNSLIKLFL